MSGCNDPFLPNKCSATNVFTTITDVYHERPCVCLRVYSVEDFRSNTNCVACLVIRWCSKYWQYKNGWNEQKPISTSCCLTICLLSTKCGLLITSAKACLTQNTRLIRLAIRVNHTFNRTNRGLIRVTLGPFECIRESRVWVLKLLKNWHGCHVRV